MSTFTIQEDFLALREECMWTMKCYKNFRHLYEHDRTLDLLKYSAGRFFHDMNIVLQEYCLLQIGKMTDPAITKIRGGERENLTIPNLDARLKAENFWGHEISELSEKIMSYRDVIQESRNRVIAHADKKTFLQNLTIGEHTEQMVRSFFENLNAYTDAVGVVLGMGPLDYRACPGKGDVIDFVSLLEDALCRFSHTVRLDRFE